MINLAGISYVDVGVLMVLIPTAHTWLVTKEKVGLQLIKIFVSGLGLKLMSDHMDLRQTRDRYINILDNTLKSLVW